LIYNFARGKTISKGYIYISLEFGGFGIIEKKMELHAYRIYHIARLLLKNGGQIIMKKYCNLQSGTIPTYFSLSESLKHSLKEVSINMED
jgi:hypothetical protein